MATQIRHVLTLEDGRQVYEDDSTPVNAGDQLTEAQVLRLQVFAGDRELLNCTIAPANDKPPLWVFDGPLPAAKEGEDYDQQIDYNWAQGQSGKTIDAYFLRSGPSWLGYVPAPNGGLPRLQGTRPAGNTETIVTLTARQTGGLSTDKSLTLPVGSNVAIYGLVQLTADRRLFIRTGPQGKTPPIHKLDGPAGWTDTARREATAGSAEAIDNKTYYFYDTSRTGLLNGDYVLTTEFMGQTLYASFSLGSAETRFVLDYQTTQPTPRPVWGQWQLPSMKAGSAYTFTVPADAAVISNGQSITYDVREKPDWLTAGRDGQGRLMLSGTVPATATAAPKIVLVASAASGQTPKEFYAAFEASTDRVEEVAVTVTNVNYGQSYNSGDNVFDCFMLWRVTGSPVVWIETVINGSSSFAQGTAIAPGGAGPGGSFPSDWARFGFLGGISTLNNTNRAKLILRQGSQTGPIITQYDFGTGFTPFATKSIYTATGGGGGAPETRQRTVQGIFSGPGQNGQLVSENPMFSASFNRYDAESNTYFVNYSVGDPAGDGYEWRLFLKDRFYTVAQANAAGLPVFRDNQVLLIRVNPNTAQSTWRNQENPNFYSLNLSTSYA